MNSYCLCERENYSVHVKYHFKIALVTLKPKCLTLIKKKKRKATDNFIRF